MAKHEFKDDSSINITPLIDILFILLLFFILTSTFDLENERAIDVTLPETQSEQVVETPEIFRIVLDSDNRIYVNSQEISLNQLKEMAAVRDTSTDFVTVISADEEASHGVVMSVLDTLRLSGISSINIQVR
ncbi:MAG TPA: biopolymer transporter ExbD [Thermotogota bacterium]|nr:biopolymer transporter ExbD [Thermotogota bacterium]HPJ90098.1 biopolymer transporter ExbD [Thermotogota bacterium]HPR95693.1 biopolymer transporter ExbD [Thermotogota bacterium]